VDDSNHSCRDAKQSTKDVMGQCLCCVDSTCRDIAFTACKMHLAACSKQMLNESFSQHARCVEQQQGRQVPASGGCASRCDACGGHVAQGVCLRCNLHLGGILARLRCVKPAIFVHFILACQQRADCRRTSRLLSVIRQLAVDWCARGGGR